MEFEECIQKYLQLMLCLAYAVVILSLKTATGFAINTVSHRRLIPAPTDRYHASVLTFLWDKLGWITCDLIDGCPEVEKQYVFFDTEDYSSALWPGIYGSQRKLSSLMTCS